MNLNRMLEDGEKPLTLRQQERIAESLNVEFSSCYYVDEDISRQLLNKLVNKKKERNN